MKKILLFCLAVLLTLGACVEDNGNYKYTEINEVEAVLPALYQRIYIEDYERTIRIEPELTQTMADNLENLTFSWKYSTTSVAVARNQTEPVGTGMYYDLVIPANDTQFNHYFWLEIHDAITGLTYPFQTRIQVVKPFVNTWAVLHQDDGGVAKLGAIEYVLDTEPIAHTDIFDEFGYAPLTGQPVALGEDNDEDAEYLVTKPVRTDYNVTLLMTTNAEESGAYASWLKFMPYTADVFLPMMVQDFSTAGFDPALTTYMHKPTSNGGTIINDGKLFQLTGRGLKIYKSKVDAEVTGSVYISHALRFGSISILYDSDGKRFLYYQNNAVGNRNVSAPFDDAVNTQTIKLMSRPANSVDLGNIAHEVLYIGIQPRNPPASTVMTTTRSFALANGTDGKSYAYLFNPISSITNTGQSAIASLKSFNTPAGLDASSCFASSMAYSEKVFFSAGSTVYALDMGTGVATQIYDNPAAGDVVAMRMARQEVPSSGTYDFEVYGHDDLGRSLGVAYSRGTTGEFVVLNLNEAGTVLDRQVYAGFGPIKDIAFIVDIKR